MKEEMREEKQEGKWRVEMIFLEGCVLLPGCWTTREEAEWAIAQWKQKVSLYSDPFVYFQEEERKAL